jgi:hypothetical protein
MLGVGYGYWALTYAIMLLTGSMLSNSGSYLGVAVGGGSVEGGSVGLTSSACVLVRSAMDEGTGEVLAARMAQEQGGRLLRSAAWRDALLSLEPG